MKKSWLKAQHSKNKDHGIQSHHFMANRWGKSANSDRFFLGLQNHCGQWLCLLLGIKATTILDSLLQSRDITLAPKVHTVKAMVFPIVMYRCESWTIKKPKHQCQRINVFETWCCRSSWESLGLQGDQTSQS